MLMHVAFICILLFSVFIHKVLLLYYLHYFYFITVANLSKLYLVFGGTRQLHVINYTVFFSYERSHGCRIRLEIKLAIYKFKNIAIYLKY